MYFSMYMVVHCTVLTMSVLKRVAYEGKNHLDSVHAVVGYYFKIKWIEKSAKNTQRKGV